MSDSKPPDYLDRFFEACASGDLAALRELLDADPGLARMANPAGQYGGWTGLHSAAQSGHLEAVCVLLQHGADPNAREAGDNTYPLHWAAADRHLEVVRTLLDAGGDVHGFGDVHELDAVGWATFFHAPGRAPGHDPEVVSLLLERGARHHIFSAMALGDLALIREVVERNPKALARRMSRFEQGQTPLHFALTLKRNDILALLIELGADLEATDQTGQTALAVAMLRGDREVMRLLHAAGARQPESLGAADLRAGVANLASATRKIVPGISVPDIAATLAWYTSLGFTEVGRYAADGVVNWGMLSFGKAELMLGKGGTTAPPAVSLWFYTDKVDELYQLLKSRQLAAARALLAGEPGDPQDIEFEEDIYDPFYGGRQFSIRDLNGYTLVFYRE
jgi:ankyrin repeat protein/catechol 2,3-dioxygenase-like lactoylglutathione lyase family enzyme